MAGTGVEAEAVLRQSRERTVLAHLEAETQGDLAATLATFKAGAARLEQPGGEIADGPAEVADTYRELFAGFPDLRFFPELEPGSLCHHGDSVIGEARLQGTHKGTFRGLPPTGRRSGPSNSKIAIIGTSTLLCERVYFDRLTLFIQLGVARDPNTRAGRLATLVNHPVTLVQAALRSRRSATGRPSVGCRWYRPSRRTWPTGAGHTRRPATARVSRRGASSSARCIRPPLQRPSKPPHQMMPSSEDTSRHSELTKLRVAQMWSIPRLR